MKEVMLYEHNEVALEKLIETLKHNKCATVDHATGTGKTPIQLKYLAMLKNKKYLLLTPRYPIIEQFFKTCYKIGITPEDINVDAMIYRSLLDLDMDKLYDKYDGIIFDEYHRIGAKETYKKVKQLKARLEESDDDKKFIGFTATPIRYLDNERNMTEEIFDGNVASKLSLAEAMINGILPVPMTINSKIACREEYGYTRRKVEKLAPSKEKEQLMKRLNKIDKQINNGQMDNKQMINKYIKGKNGKYIVFCNTVEKLDRYYKEIDEWFASLGKIKKYKVHSGQKRDENQNQLDEFNDSKEGISVLLCIDILNEGVHVDDIDGVILLRKTTSPIIYFQQIGRALSFAGRDRQIKIFDLVNNFGNHNAIDLVYQEYQDEVRRLIEEHPEKREYYEEQLRKFVIMDETREILKELREIQKQVTPLVIIESKIDYSIEILLKINQQKGNISIFDDEEMKKAYTTISKYARYVNNNQFKKLSELDIILPEELSMTWEEREELLGGFKSVYEKEQQDNDLWFEEILKFMNQTGRRPDINSNDEKERMLAEKYLRCIIELKIETKKELEDVFETNGIPLNFYEKILLGKKVNTDELQQLVTTAKGFIDNGKQLPDYLYKAIGTVIEKYNVRIINELLKLMKDNDEIVQREREKREKERYIRITNGIEFLEKNIELSEEELMKSETFQDIRKLSSRDKKYINRKYKVFKKKMYKEMINGADDADVERFCKKAKSLTIEDISDYYNKIDEDKEIYTSVVAIVEFMTNNEGKKPNKNSEEELERKLAIKLEELMENGNLGAQFENIGQDIKCVWYSPNNMIREIAIERFRQNDTKLVILRCLEFWLKNGRRPLKNSKNEEEVALAEEYEKKCISSLAPEYIQSLNKIFNSRRSLQKTCQQFIDNIKASSEEGR